MYNDYVVAEVSNTVIFALLLGFRRVALEYYSKRHTRGVWGRAYLIYSPSVYLPLLKVLFATTLCLLETVMYTISCAVRSDMNVLFVNTLTLIPNDFIACCIPAAFANAAIFKFLEKQVPQLSSFSEARFCIPTRQQCKGEHAAFEFRLQLGHTVAGCAHHLKHYVQASVVSLARLKQHCSGALSIVKTQRCFFCPVSCSPIHILSALPPPETSLSYSSLMRVFRFY